MNSTMMIAETERVAEKKIGSVFMVVRKNQPLHSSVRQALRNYFSQLENQPLANLYELVLAEAEVPLLETVMEYTRGNQSHAAIVLGLSRGTLRKKLKIYGMLK